MVSTEARQPSCSDVFATVSSIDLLGQEMERQLNLRPQRLMSSQMGQRARAFGPVRMMLLVDCVEPNKNVMVG